MSRPILPPYTARLTMYGQVMVSNVPNRFNAHAGLSVTSIVGAAMDVVDEDGLRALTMRRLGTELDVQAMSIYHHVPNKSALLDLLVGRLLDSVDDARPDTDALALVERQCRQLRSALHDHPNLSPLVAERLPPAVRASAAVSAMTDRLVEAGFDREAASWIVDAFVGFAVGHTVVELAAGAGRDDGAAFDTGLRFLLIGLRDELGL